MKFPNRMGNKERIAPLLNDLFPSHKTYIELFFGAGGMFFNKSSVAKYNILNDLSREVYDLYQVLYDPINSLRLKEMLAKVPYHQEIFKITVPSWFGHDDVVYRAAAFVIASSWAFKGKSTTLKASIGGHSTKGPMLNNLDTVLNYIDRYSKESSTHFLCGGYEKVLQSLTFKGKPEDVFVYADPPYINTTNNYKSGCSVMGKKSIDYWDATNFRSLVEHLVSYPYKFGISESYNEEVVNIAKEYNLNIIEVAKVPSITGYREEILITNYEQTNRLL